MARKKIAYGAVLIDKTGRQYFAGTNIYAPNQSEAMKTFSLYNPGFKVLRVQRLKK